MNERCGKIGGECLTFYKEYEKHEGNMLKAEQGKQQNIVKKEEFFLFSLEGFSFILYELVEATRA